MTKNAGKKGEYARRQSRRADLALPALFGLSLLVNPYAALSSQTYENATFVNHAGSQDVKSPFVFSTSKEIIFVAEDLDIPAGLIPLGKGYEVHRISSDEDGIEQIARVLKGRSGIGALHILSHGRAGQLDLGNLPLTRQTMDGHYADLLKTIGGALAEHGDILIYGCDFAAGDEGKEALAQLGRLTSADVAASNNTTGHKDFGGDWTLEAEFGRVSTAHLQLSDYPNKLWTGEVFGGGFFGDDGVPSGAVAPHLQFGLPGTAITVGDLSGPNVFAGFFGSVTYVGVRNVTATSEAQALANGDYISTTWVIPSHTGYGISRGLHSRLNQNSSSAQTAIYVYDPVAGTNTPITAGGNLDGGGTITLPLINKLQLEAGRTYEIRYYFWNCNASAAGGSNECYFDNPRYFIERNEAHTAFDDGFSGLAGQTLNGDLYIDNGSGADSDPENDIFTITQINGAAITEGAPIALANGTLTITDEDAGAFSFVPNAGFSGTQNFTYTTRDQGAHSSTATVQLTYSTAIAADADSVSTASGPSGQSNALDVIDGDTLNGAQAAIGDLIPSVLTPATPVNPGDPVPVLNLATGFVDIPANTPAGTYTITYQICASADPTACASNVATIEVLPTNDLAITKTNTPGVNGEVDQAGDAVTSGSIITYTLIATNNGPDSSTGAVVSDTPVSGLTCPATNAVTIAGSGVPPGSFTIADLTGPGITLGTLANGDSTTLSFSCQVD